MKDGNGRCDSRVITITNITSLIVVIISFDVVGKKRSLGAGVEIGRQEKRD